MTLPEQLAWPKLSCFCGNESNVLRAFFHLACEVKGGDHDKVGVCLPDINLGVEAFHVYLGRSNGLLPRVHAFRKPADFCHILAYSSRSRASLLLILIEGNQRSLK